MPGHRTDLPRPFHSKGRKRAADGDEIELESRLVSFDPLQQQEHLESRVRLWRGDEMVAEERYGLVINSIFPQELLQLLREAGFRDVALESGYSGQAAGPDDGEVTFVAQKPA